MRHTKKTRTFFREATCREPPPPHSASRHRRCSNQSTLTRTTRETATALRVPGRHLDALLCLWDDEMLASLRLSLSFHIFVYANHFFLFYLSEFFHSMVETMVSHFNNKCVLLFAYGRCGKFHRELTRGVSVLCCTATPKNMRVFD